MATGAAGREETRWSYRMLTLWARAALTVFYRRTDCVSLEWIPPGAPVVLAANHSNGLADIAVIVACAPRFPHFLAAATWWRSAPARALFRLGGVIPVHRARDGNAHANADTFAACHAALAERRHLCIFPEGEMHAESALMPLRTGAARIALGAAGDAGVRGVVVVPVGVVYDDRGRFRSDVEIHAGEPIAVDTLAELARTDPEKAVRALTDLLADRLAAVTVNHGSEREARVVARAVEIDTSSDDAIGPEMRNARRRALASALAVAPDGGDRAVSVLERAVDDYDRARHAARLPRRAAVGSRAPGAVRLLAGAPAAVLTTAVHVPALAGAATAGRVARGAGWKATVAGVAGTLLAPVSWMVGYAVARRRVGRPVAAALVVLAATRVPAALAWWDGLLRWWTARREAELARRHPELARALLGRRAAVRAEIAALLDPPT